MLNRPKTRLHFAADEAVKFVKETGCDSLACDWNQHKNEKLGSAGKLAEVRQALHKTQGPGSLAHRLAYNGDVAALKAT